jgi:predicted DNA-binding transcriptional regulator AlpA
MEYNFTLKYQINHGDDGGDDVAERLGGGSCDDALLGLGQPGRIALNFSRNANSAELALLSALADVRQALPEAVLIEAAPDFVGLSDVADSVGVTRQNLRKLMLQHYPTFPAPVHEGKAVMWHLADLLTWLREKMAYQVNESEFQMAQLTKQLNLAKSLPNLNKQLLKDMKPFIY